MTVVARGRDATSPERSPRDRSVGAVVVLGLARTGIALARFFTTRRSRPLRPEPAPTRAALGLEGGRSARSGPRRGQPTHRSAALIASHHQPARRFHRRRGLRPRSILVAAP
jgi:hypothetical protein